MVKEKFFIKVVLILVIDFHQEDYLRQNPSEWQKRNLCCGRAISRPSSNLPGGWFAGKIGQVVQLRNDAVRAAGQTIMGPGAVYRLVGACS